MHDKTSVLARAIFRHFPLPLSVPSSSAKKIGRAFFVDG